MVPVFVEDENIHKLQLSPRTPFIVTLLFRDLDAQESRHKPVDQVGISVAIMADR